MSRLNLETLTKYSLLDTIASPAMPETASGGDDSFGALFERARSALSHSSSTSNSAKDAPAAKDSHAAENHGPTEKHDPKEDHGPADDVAPHKASDDSSEASPSDTDAAAREHEPSDSPGEASDKPEAADAKETKPEDDSAEAVDGDETSDDARDIPLPAESNATDGAPAAGTPTEGESGEQTEVPSEDDSKDVDEEAAALIAAVVADGAVPAPQTPPTEPGAAAESSPGMAPGVQPAGPLTGTPQAPKQIAGAIGQPGADPAAADAAETTGSGDETAAAKEPQASQGQSATAPAQASEVVNAEGGQGEGNSDQAGDGADRSSHRSESGKGKRGAAARDDQPAVASSTNTAGQSGVSPQVDPQSQPGAVAAPAAGSVAAAAANATAKDTVPSESKGSESGTGESGAREVNGGQSTAQEQPSRASGAQASGDLPEVSVADRVRFVQRVARAFESVGEQGGTVRLRLHPPELGALRLEVTVRNGAMTARLEAETPAAQGMLLENLPTLRERLAEQNIRVDRFDVDLMGQSSGGSADGTDAQAQSGRDQAQPRPYYGNQRNAGVESGNQPRRPVTSRGTSRFDVIV